MEILLKGIVAALLVAMLREIGLDINFLCVPYDGGTVFASGMAAVTA